jgi:hypothetical protein
MGQLETEGCEGAQGIDPGRKVLRRIVPNLARITPGAA